MGPQCRIAEVRNCRIDCNSALRKFGSSAIETMTGEELDQKRREHWHTAGTPLQTLDDARAFVAEVGLCLFAPLRPPALLPAFVAAWTGPRKQPAATQSAGEAHKPEVHSADAHPP